jgi:hypothetical protein
MVRHIPLSREIGVLISFAICLLAGAVAAIGAPPATVGDLREAIAQAPAGTTIKWNCDPPYELGPPVPPLPTVGTPFGNFALQPGGRGKDDPREPIGSQLISVEELKMPGVDGMTIRFRPAWIWPGTGQWDWRFVDASVARCHAAGDDYTLLLMGGGPNPLLEANLAFYERAAAEMGRRYGSDPLWVAPHITGASPPGHSEELFWGSPMPAAAERANERMMRAWRASGGKLRYNILAGSANDPAAIKRLVNYGASLGGGSAPMLYKNNAMSAKIPLDWAGNQLVVWAGKAGYGMGWEMLQPTGHPAFGGSWDAAMKKVDALLNQADVPLEQRYLAVYQGDLDELE